jgi:hypothetical protein
MKTIAEMLHNLMCDEKQIASRGEDARRLAIT